MITLRSTLFIIISLIFLSQIAAKRETYGYLAHWTLSNNPHWKTRIRFDLLTTVAFFSVTVNGKGNITDPNVWLKVAKELVPLAHKNGCKVELCVPIFDSNTLSQLLNNAQSRANCIRNLIDLVKQGGGDGVNIDFENVPSSLRNPITQFMKELSSAFWKEKMTTSMAIYPRTHAAFDLKSLYNYTDRLFAMGYNYHWESGPKAGGVAPYPSIVYSINQLVKEMEKKDKLIFGLPYYGIEWPTETDAPGSKTTGKGTAYTFGYIKEQKLPRYQRRWDNDCKCPWYAFKDEKGWRQGWYDDDESLRLKFDYIKSYGLLGTGMWALEFDRGLLWGEIERYLRN